MAQEPFLNPSEAQLAWDDLRTSRAFPAIVGGLAGAGIGVAILFIANRLRAPKKTLPAAFDANGNPMNIVYLPAPQGPRFLGFSPGDLITLATIGLSLVRQIQDMGQIKDQGLDAGLSENAKQIAEAKPGVPASPAHTMPTAKRK